MSVERLQLVSSLVEAVLIYLFFFGIPGSPKCSINISSGARSPKALGIEVEFSMLPAPQSFGTYQEDGRDEKHGRQSWNNKIPQYLVLCFIPTNACF